MKKTCGMLVASLFVTSAVGWLTPARAEDPAVRAELEGAYGRLAQAFRAKDSSVAQRFLQYETTSDFVSKEPGGTRTRQQMLDQLKKEPWAPVHTARFTLDPVSVEGDEATVVVSSRFEGMSSDPKTTGDSSGKAHELDAQAVNRDTWVKTARGWKLKSHERLREKLTMDGKPFTPPTPQPPRRMRKAGEPAK